MPLPFPITAVDNPLGPDASSRVDVRTVDGTSTVGYATVTGDFQSTVVAGGEVLFATQDRQQTTNLRSGPVGPRGSPRPTGTPAATNPWGPRAPRRPVVRKSFVSRWVRRV